MIQDMNSFRSLIARYRRAILIFGLSFLAVTGLLVVGAGFLVYKTAALATDQVKVWSSEQALPQPRLPEPGFVEEVVLSVASGWLQQGLADAEVRPIKDGLACFDALGGPSPVDIVAYVETRTQDPELLTHLRGLKQNLASSINSASGPAACASWILNS